MHAGVAWNCVCGLLATYVVGLHKIKGLIFSMERDWSKIMEFAMIY
jgi:hypothetical protein